MDCAAIDFGGSITDVVLRHADGREVFYSEAAIEQPGTSEVARLLRSAGAAGEPDLVAVTGGRSGRLSDEAWSKTLVRVGESEATAAGGLLCAPPTPCIVVSVGTGTGMVLASPPGDPLRLVGSGIGGGTLMGLARLLVGTTDVAELGGLARSGDVGRCDLTVGDIIGQGVGPVSAAATASHFGRLTRSDGSTRREDLAAALVALVGETALRISIDAVQVHQARSIVLLGHSLDVPGFREAILRVPGVSPDFVIMPEAPGFQIARGALEVALSQHPDLAG